MTIALDTGLGISAWHTTERQINGRQGDGAIVCVTSFSVVASASGFTVSTCVCKIKHTERCTDAHKIMYHPGSFTNTLYHRNRLEGVVHNTKHYVFMFVIGKVTAGLRASAGNWFRSYLVRCVCIPGRYKGSSTSCFRGAAKWGDWSPFPAMCKASRGCILLTVYPKSR